MSVHVSSAVWRLDLPSTPKMVLLYLADKADDDGANAYPSQARIAQECGLSVRQVRRILEFLMAEGVIDREREAGQHRPANYRVCPERGKPLPPLTPANMSALNPPQTGQYVRPAPPPDRTFATPRPDICDTPDRTFATPDRTFATPDRTPMSADPSYEPSDLDPSDLDPAAAIARARARGIRAYEDCAGSLTQSVSEKIIAELSEGTPAEWIEAACAEAAIANVRKWNYIEAILDRWKREGFKADRRPKNEHRGRRDGRHQSEQDLSAFDAFSA